MPTRQAVSARLDPDLSARLGERAQALGVSRSQLVARYADEGLRMDAHPGILFADGPAGRRPRVAGTGLDVWEVVETVRANAGSPERAAAYLELAPARVEAALGYYGAHAEEVDAWAARARALADEEETAARRTAELVSG
jgi:uncharacterized protein (DUF433 family)